MSKYIDAENLKEQITNLRSESCIGEVDDGYEFAKSEIIDIIDSLQQEQPEVDWEMFDKEVTKIWGRCAAEPNDTIACLHIESFIEIVHHFYNLGLNARK